MEGIVETPEVLGGEPRLEGRRIGVRHIAEMVIDGGMEPVEVADQLEIQVADVHRALTFYYSHPEKMSEVRRRHEEAFDRLAAEAVDPPETLTK